MLLGPTFVSLFVLSVCEEAVFTHSSNLWRAKVRERSLPIKDAPASVKKASEVFSRVPIFMVTALPHVYFRMTELHHESRSMTAAATMEESSGNVQYSEAEQISKKTKKNS